MAVALGTESVVAAAVATGDEDGGEGGGEGSGLRRGSVHHLPYPEIDEKARKELLEMAGTRWKHGGSRDTKLARKKTVSATRGGGSEQRKVTCDLCDISVSNPESEACRAIVAHSAHTGP
ncbi:hypothetical protein C8F04DRAFT_1188716 [Mycena alexandri]|uniref:Uncharacterized protein n=1 Tax=Mycena alexandri TaxID=1745969 RepID=A0AAD6SK67_9AGAR|nr:hypothetical protein C8F04DRAFT_1188716 [Mycena alexandri]